MAWVIEKWEYGKIGDRIGLERLCEKYRQTENFIVVKNGEKDLYIVVGHSDCAASKREAEVIVKALNSMAEEAK